MKCPECGATIKPNEYQNIYKCPECARRFTLSNTLTRIPITKSNVLSSEPIGIYIYNTGRDSHTWEVPIYDKVDSFHKYTDLKEEVAEARIMSNEEKNRITTINIIYF